VTSAGLSVGIISYAIYCFTASRVNDLIVVYQQAISETVGILQAVSELDRQKGDLES